MKIDWNKLEKIADNGMTLMALAFTCAGVLLLLAVAFLIFAYAYTLLVN